jgi:hypothetical protein
MLEKALSSRIAHTADETVRRVQDAAEAKLSSQFSSSNVVVDSFFQTGPEIVSPALSDDDAAMVSALGELAVVRWAVVRRADIEPAVAVSHEAFGLADAAATSDG